MSLKKATPKAVFEACEQLESLEQGWNRDDVRSLIGGGSFSVIDPLIQAWRKLQPVREVAPSVPSDLLIQVATMLEQQVADYIEEVECRDQEREKTLLEVNEEIAQNLQLVECELSEQLESSQQANHDLEAECSRLEAELDNKHQLELALELKLQVAKEVEATLNQRLVEQQKFYEQALDEQKQARQLGEKRLSEQYEQQTSQLKLEAQQQLAQQKTQLSDAAELAENRLMRLLDQGRNELKEQQLSSSNKIELLRNEASMQTQLASRQGIEIKTLESALLQARQDAEQCNTQQQAQVSQLNNEKLILQQQIIEQGKERDDLKSLKDVIQLLQDQLSTQ